MLPIATELQPVAALAALLELDPLLVVPIHNDPYPWISAAGCLAPAALPALRRDFPVLPRPG
jgi:SM-20-related protein